MDGFSKNNKTIKFVLLSLFFLLLGEGVEALAYVIGNGENDLDVHWVYNLSLLGTFLLLLFFLNRSSLGNHLYTFLFYLMLAVGFSEPETDMRYFCGYAFLLTAFCLVMELPETKLKRKKIFDVTFAMAAAVYCAPDFSPFLLIPFLGVLFCCAGDINNWLAPFVGFAIVWWLVFVWEYFFDMPHWSPFLWRPGAFHVSLYQWIGVFGGALLIYINVRMGTFSNFRNMQPKIYLNSGLLILAYIFWLSSPKEGMAYMLPFIFPLSNGFGYICDNARRNHQKSFLIMAVALASLGIKAANVLTAINK